MPADRPIARGRATDVFAHGPHAVLRRYRDGEPCDVGREAAAMRFLHERGYPVPAVHEAGEREMVLERIDGPTMLDDLSRRPWRISMHARTLATLHEQLHAIEAPDWLDAHRRLPTVCEGDRVLHLDLHPENVLMTPSGPVVIDWSNVSRGAPEADVALTWVIMATSDVPGGAAARLTAAVGRRAFVDTFLRHAGRDVAEPLVPLVAAARLDADPHVLPEEAERLRALAGGAA
jgi:aminoglycoside phosphotransferase (APT) family kinase protein